MLDELKMLLNEYVSRQQLVYEAIMQLKPVSIIAHDKSIDALEIVLIAKKYGDVPQSGIWYRYGTWKYYLHGGGCRLTNIISGEPIEWDAPHIQHFYLPWFMKWYRWVEKINDTSNEPSDDMIYAMLGQLEEIGFIERLHPQSSYPKIHEHQHLHLVQYPSRSF